MSCKMISSVNQCIWDAIPKEQAQSSIGKPCQVTRVLALLLKRFSTLKINHKKSN